MQQFKNSQNQPWDRVRIKLWRELIPSKLNLSRLQPAKSLGSKRSQHNKNRSGVCQYRSFKISLINSPSLLWKRSQQWDRFGQMMTTSPCFKAATLGTRGLSSNRFWGARQVKSSPRSKSTSTSLTRLRIALSQQRPICKATEYRLILLSCVWVGHSETWHAILLLCKGFRHSLRLRSLLSWKDWRLKAWFQSSYMRTMIRASCSCVSTTPVLLWLKLIKFYNALEKRGFLMNEDQV